ncbi:MAG: cell wall-binding repeat-containing protein [Peptococcaceae bacterium]|nr:cell wall-binding repeat-containing protein [Peptococcaceae bacterium]
MVKQGNKRGYASIILFLAVLLFISFLLPSGVLANGITTQADNVDSDVVWNSQPKQFTTQGYQLVKSYKGSNGVTINSYSKAYNTTEKLIEVYNEFCKNTFGEELAYLSRIDLFPDFREGKNIMGRWYGQWVNGKLDKNRYIEIYGCDSLDLMDISLILAHEYGHHFTYYWINKKEGKMDFNNTVYAKIRKLNSYSKINSGHRKWNPAEIAAEDYKQLFGSPTLAQNENYLCCPQENFEIPLAWEVEGLYDYWVNLSGVEAKKNSIPPTQPHISMTYSNGRYFLKWSKSEDDEADPVRYVLMHQQAISDNYYYNTRYTLTTDTAQVIYKISNMNQAHFNLYAVDKSGNAVATRFKINFTTNQLTDVTYRVPSALPFKNRLAGNDRYETSIEISKKGWPNGSPNAVLVTGKDFPDALTAAPLAKKYNAPILLTRPDSLDKKTEAEILRLGVRNIYIVGGYGAVGKEIEDKLKAMGINCTRISGNTRYDTAIEVAKELGSFDKIFVVTGDNFPDALSISSLAGSLNAPIILMPNKGMPLEFKNLIMGKEIAKTYVIGGSAAVSEKIFAELPNVERISGQNRYHTNNVVLNKFETAFDNSIVYVATGENYPDALSASALAALNKAPIVLLTDTSTSYAKKYFASKGIEDGQVTVIGGEKILRSKLINSLF